MGCKLRKKSRTSRRAEFAVCIGKPDRDAPFTQNCNRCRGGDRILPMGTGEGALAKVHRPDNDVADVKRTECGTGTYDIGNGIIRANFMEMDMASVNG